ncbi:MAG: flagellin [Eubacteriales bacterium]|nr:flagellin [Eubacteriales bacterium]
MVVQHNITAMNANRMLGVTSSAQAKSTEKLSSGYRINRAADDAAGLSISEKMRKQIRGLTQASSNAQDGISAVQTAEGALNETQSMLQRMNELANQASNGTNSESDKQSIQDEIDQLITEIDRVSETTKFNEIYLLKGDAAGTKSTTYSYKGSADVLSTDLFVAKTDGSGTFETVAAGSLIEEGVTYYSSVQTEQVGAEIGSTALTAAGSTYVTEADVFKSSGYYKLSGSVYVEVKSGETYSSNITYYTVTRNSLTGGVEYKAVADSTTSNFLTTVYVAASDNMFDAYGNKVKKEAVVNTNDTYYSTIGKKYTGTIVDDISAFKASSTDFQFMDKYGNEIAANGLSTHFDKNGEYTGGLYIKGADGNLVDARDKVNAYVEKGQSATGTLKFSLQVGADATDNNQIDVEIEAMNAEILGVDKLKVTGADNTNAKNAIETIDAALKKVSAQRSTLGAVQNRLEHTIANLDNIVENTTAAESQIRDTDMAAEMVNYSKNNILAQAGQSMLAQSNQANQGVLSLLG